MAPPTDSSGALSGRAVILRIDGLRLMLPQGDVAELEPVLDLDRFRPPPQGIGWLQGRGRAVPVYCLSGALKPIVSAPPLRRLCALLADQPESGAQVAILCDDAELVNLDAARLHAIPAALALPGNASTAIALLPQGLVWVTNRAALTRCVAEPRAASAAAADGVDESPALPQTMTVPPAPSLPGHAGFALDALPVPIDRPDPAGEGSEGAQSAMPAGAQA